MNNLTNGVIDKHKFAGHTIKVSENLGWSDVRQQMVVNGYYVTISGPYCVHSEQCYSYDFNYLCSLILNRINKAKGIL